MISKKTNKADLEKKRSLFFEIGLVIALAIALIAFECTPVEKPADNFLSYLDDPICEELKIDITRVEQKKEMKKPKAIEIKIIKNEVDLPGDDIDLNMDVDINDCIFDIPELPDEPGVEDTFIIVEHMPEYRNGGLGNFHKYIQEIVKYPREAVDLGLEGTVYLTFVVDKRGFISNIKILRGVDPLLDNEAIAAIEKSERWKPGIQAGRKVNVSMAMPVTFRLQ